MKLFKYIILSLIYLSCIGCNKDNSNNKYADLSYELNINTKLSNDFINLSMDFANRNRMTIKGPEVNLGLYGNNEYIVVIYDNIGFQAIVYTANGIGNIALYCDPDILNISKLSNFKKKSSELYDIYDNNKWHSDYIKVFIRSEKSKDSILDEANKLIEYKWGNDTRNKKNIIYEIAMCK